MKIVLTSCGIINPELKEKFFKLVNKAPEQIKMLYITTAVDGEKGDLSWVDREYETILALGIREENITEYKIGAEAIDLKGYDVIYMMGGNTFYLMKKIRDYGFAESLREALEAGVVYVGSSAGSIILGASLKPAEIFGDKMEGQGMDGLNIIDGVVVPHMNKRSEQYQAWLKTWDGKSYLLYDGDGILV
jgi:dipeptidase E